MTDMTPQNGLEPMVQHAHQDTDDVRMGSVVGFGVGLTAFTVLVALALGLVFRVVQVNEERTRESRPLLFAVETGQFPGPTLQDNPARDVPNLWRVQHARLSKYEWVERGQVARIPIDRAMTILSERGLPRFERSDRTSEPTPGDAVRRARASQSSEGSRVQDVDK